MKRVLIVFCALIGFNNLVTAQEIRFDRMKTVLLLHKLDSLILFYEESSNLNEISKQSNIEDFRTIQLFADTSQVIFDDINPNIQKKREDRIIEKEKSVRQYFNDIKNTYSIIDCKIKWTDLGNASKRLYYLDSNLYVPVHIEKELKGYTRDTLSEGFGTSSRLKMLVQILDTNEFNLKIANISKTWLQSTVWQHYPPYVKQKKIETIFTLRPLFSYLYVDNPGSRSLIIDSTYKGSYGFSGELLFNILLKRKSYGTVGLSLGVGGSWYNAEYSQRFYSSLAFMTDRDGDEYYRITDASDLKEKWQFASVDFPLYLNFEHWKKKNVNKGSYFRIGGKFSYFFPASYTTNAVYSQSGYYPKYDVTMAGNNDEYNFFEGRDLKTNGKADITPYNYSVDLHFGKMRRSKKRGTVIYFGISLSAYIQNFMPASQTGAFYDNEHYGSMLSDFKSGRLGYAGFSLGFRKANKNEVLLRPKSVQYLDKF